MQAESSNENNRLYAKDGQEDKYLSNSLIKRQFAAFFIPTERNYEK